MQGTPGFEPSPATGQTHPDRRAWERYSCPEGIPAEAGNNSLSPRFRAVRIVNVSRAGLGLLLPEPLPLGILLRVRIEGGRGPRPLMARVVHATEQPGGWLHGCELTQLLPIAELVDILDLMAGQGDVTDSNS